MQRSGGKTKNSDCVEIVGGNQRFSHLKKLNFAASCIEPTKTHLWNQISNADWHAVKSDFERRLSSYLILLFLRWSWNQKDQIGCLDLAHFWDWSSTIPSLGSVSSSILQSGSLQNLHGLQGFGRRFGPRPGTSRFLKLKPKINIFCFKSGHTIGDGWQLGVQRHYRHITHTFTKWYGRNSKQIHLIFGIARSKVVD